MTGLAVFLHVLSVLSLGPWIAGVLRHAAHGGGWRTLVAPTLELNRGLKQPGAPSPVSLAVLTGSAVAGLLIPFFTPEAVLGFLGDGFVALGLLVGLSAGRLPLRASSVIAVAASLWTLGSLTGTTDLAQAFALWQPSLGTGLIALGLALGVAPVLTAPVLAAPDAPGEGLEGALAQWSRWTLQLCWLALATMALPGSLPLSDGGALLLLLGRFLFAVSALAWVLGAVQARWPRLPLAEAGAACSMLALVLAKLAA